MSEKKKNRGKAIPMEIKRQIAAHFKEKGQGSTNYKVP